MKKMIIISFLIFSMLSARQLMLNTNEAFSTKAAHSLNKNVRTQVSNEHNFGSSIRTEIILENRHGLKCVLDAEIKPHGDLADHFVDFKIICWTH